MTPIRKLFVYLFVLAIFPSGQALAQKGDIASQENRFVELYSKIISSIQEDNDSVSFYSDEFTKEFTKFIKNNPATLSYPFKRLDSLCYVITSDDGNFRVYSWDELTGGTMHFYDKIYQWKAGGKVFTKVPGGDEFDAGRFCSEIFTVVLNNKTHYLTVDNGIFSTRESAQSVSAYTIEGNKLADTARVFKAKTKKLNNIDVQFDFFSVVDRPERPLELITYDDKRKIMYIPVVDGAGQVTKKNILYELKGRYLEFIGIETGKR
jgi:hypothetical protein